MQQWEAPYGEELERVGYGPEIELKVYPLRKNLESAQKEVSPTVSIPQSMRDNILDDAVSLEELEAFVHQRVFDFSLSDAQIEQNVHQLYEINGVLKRKIALIAKASKSSEPISIDVATRRSIYSEISLKITHEIARYQQQTRQYLEDDLFRELSERIESDEKLNIDNVAAPRRLTFVMNKERVASKLQKMKQFKRTLLDELKNSTLTAIQEELLKQYVKKLNVLIATSAQKGVHTTFSSEKRRQRDAGRLTKFIFGVSHHFLPTGERSVIPAIVQKKAKQQIKMLLDDATAQNERIKSLGLDPCKVLDSMPGSPYTFTSEQARVIAEWALGEYGLLSKESYTTYSTSRTGPASDNKWQAIVSLKASTMSVNGIKKVVLIPAERTYNILQIVSILIGHEIEGHVLQGVNKERMPLMLFRKGADRAALWAEMGAMYNQDKVSQECFGIISPAQPDYIPAMIAKENGGNYLDVVKAMFDAHANRIAAMPTEEEKIRARRSLLKRAINRAFRLYNGTDDFETRGTGIINSRDTVYLEQDIVMDFMKEIGMEHLSFLGGVNLESISSLMKMGLLNIHSIITPKNVAQKFWIQVRHLYTITDE